MEGQVGVAAGGAALVTAALQWARAQKAWPEWANALVVANAALLATVLAGVPVYPLSGFTGAFTGVLITSGAAGYLASTVSHLAPHIVPETNSRGAAAPVDGGSK